ncbi:hypothetical protein LTR53_013492 [Teratosphaeriaceae sp. CCFEE 6253]|nr:hypothetical protein LTR53_013492 [Teratosphaeriaceae sp. CCFEE 6253]
MVTPEQYEALPLSIQKKYFSSAERLRITQDTAAQKRKRQRRKQTWLSSTSSTDLSSRSRSTHELRGFQSPSCTIDRTEAHADQCAVDPHRAAWFSKLPDKLRRQHVGREKGVLLTAACVRAGDKPQRDSPSRPALLHGHNCRAEHPAASGHAAPSTGDPNGHREVETRSHSSRSTVNSGMGIFAFQYGDSAPVTGPAPPTRDPPARPTATDTRLKRKSTYRALSLTPLALPPPTLAPLPDAPVLVRTTVNSARLSRPYTDPLLLSTTTFPQSPHHLNPEARNLLHESPASQPHFTETVESGHLSSASASPSSAGTEGSLPIQRASSPDDNNTDATSLPSAGTSTPPPTLLSRPARKPTQAASFDSGVALPLHSNAVTERGRSPSPLSGLTRPPRATPPPLRQEGRASEGDGLHSWQRTVMSGVAAAAAAAVVDSDPLALEPLCITDDVTGAHGAFAGQGRDGGGRAPRGLGRVWKSLRRRR